MSELTIQLRINPETGRKDIVVHLSSDEDALPLEHERQHRALVEQLLSRGLVELEELGEVVVQRDQESGESSASQSTEQQATPQRSADQNAEGEPVRRAESEDA